MSNIHFLSCEAITIAKDLTALSTCLSNQIETQEYVATIKEQVRVATDRMKQHKANITQYYQFHGILPREGSVVSVLDKGIACMLSINEGMLSQEEPSLYLRNAQVAIDSETLRSFKGEDWEQSMLHTLMFIRDLKPYKEYVCGRSKLGPLFGNQLSPSKLHYTDSLSEPPRIEVVGTYVRSEKSPWSKLNTTEAFYPQKKLTNGEPAHAGSYRNTMELLGDTRATTTNIMVTSRGDAVLYNRLLDYKKNLCQYIAQRIPENSTKMIKVGFYNDYPCIMVYIKRATVIKYDPQKKPSPACFEAWVDLLNSFFIGLVNHTAFMRHIPIELERRSSFGFMKPSIASTGDSMRISIGLIPYAYADLLIDCLSSLDTMLHALVHEPSALPPLSEGVFYGSPGHTRYLNGKCTTNPLDNLIQLLFARADKKGMTTVQNIVRTAYALDMFACITFDVLLRQHTYQPKDAFFASITWAVSCFQISTRNTLEFNKNKSVALTPGVKLSSNGQPFLEEVAFFEMIKCIFDRLNATNERYLHQAAQVLIENYRKKSLDNLYRSLDYCNELIFFTAITQAQTTEIGDGFGSDSEEEWDFDAERMYTKKIIVHNGMRAIWCAITVAANQTENCRLFLDSSYYEIERGLKLIENLHNFQTNVTKVKKSSEANVILYDLNACITQGEKNQDYTIEAQKILILDATSATNHTIEQHVQRFAHSRATLLLIVSSGFKNEQSGADKNQYGTVRIYTKNKTLLDNTYTDIKKIEEKTPLTSPTSHALRRLNKTLGWVHTNYSLFPRAASAEPASQSNAGIQYLK